MKPRDLAFLVLGLIAGIAIYTAFPLASRERPAVWHDVVPMPADDDERARVIDAVALDLTREANKHRNGVLLHCRLVETRDSSVRTPVPPARKVR